MSSSSIHVRVKKKNRNVLCAEESCSIKVWHTSRKKHMSQYPHRYMAISSTEGLIHKHRCLPWCFYKFSASLKKFTPRRKESHALLYLQLGNVLSKARFCQGSPLGIRAMAGCIWERGLSSHLEVTGIHRYWAGSDGYAPSWIFFPGTNVNQCFIAVLPLIMCKLPAWPVLVSLLVRL